MPKKLPSADQSVMKLRQINVLVAQGWNIGQACKAAEITEQSYYRRRNQYGGGRRSRRSKGNIEYRNAIPDGSSASRGGHCDTSQRSGLTKMC
jgi:hypothetical protein